MLREIHHKYVASYIEVRVEEVGGPRSGEGRSQRTYSVVCWQTHMVFLDDYFTKITRSKLQYGHIHHSLMSLSHAYHYATIRDVTASTISNLP